MLFQEFLLSLRFFFGGEHFTQHGFVTISLKWHETCGARDAIRGVVTVTTRAPVPPMRSCLPQRH